HSEYEQRAETWCKPAEQRAQGEDREAYHEKSLPSKGRGEPSADGKDDCVGYQIRGQHPRALVVTCAKVPRHIRQRHVGDARVEVFHERGERYHSRDQPWIERRVPCVIGHFGGADVFFHRRCTLGTTLMPGRS